MQLYDIFQEGERRAHLALPDEGPPMGDYFPDEWGSQWMDDAIREGIVATITAAPGEAAWYYGDWRISTAYASVGGLSEPGGPRGRRRERW